MNTKDKILNAGVKVFSKKGFDKASVDDIAKEAQTAKGTLYYHFKSKDEILMAIFEQGIEDFSSYLKKKIEKINLPSEKLEILVGAQIDYFSVNRDFCRIFLTEIWRFHSKLKMHIKQIQDKYLKIIEQTIEEGIAAGEFDQALDVKAVTAAVFSLVSFAGLDWAIFHPQEPKSAITKAINHLLKKGLPA